MSFEREYYENDAFWNATHYLDNENERERWASAIALLPDDVNSLLDIGCGNGTFLFKLENENKITTLMGSERSRSAIKNKICESKIIEESIHNLTESNSSFDCVACMEVIEHLPFPIYEKSLSELERVARKYILISVPYNEDRLHIQCSECSCLFNYDYHMRSYDYSDLENLFDNFSLVREKTISADVYLGLKKLKDIYYGKKYPMRENAVCPQCGYAATSQKINTPRVENRSTIRAIIKQFWPTRKKECWFLGLYERK